MNLKRHVYRNEQCCKSDPYYSASTPESVKRTINLLFKKLLNCDRLRVHRDIKDATRQAKTMNLKIRLIKDQMTLPQTLLPAERDYQNALPAIRITAIRRWNLSAYTKGWLPTAHR